MRRYSLRLLWCLFFLLLANLAAPSGARAQQSQFFPPYELYRFHMGGTNGYFYTPWYSQGVNAGYSFQGQVGIQISVLSGIYPVPDGGYTPDASTGLIPLYQWTVFQGVRSYTYLSPYYASHGSGYYFNGVMGYVYPSNVEVDPFGIGTYKLAAWYSQTRGFWFGLNGPGDPQGFEFPPDSSYMFQGIICRLPAPSRGTAPGRCPFALCGNTRSVQYNPPPPPPPPPTCDFNEEQNCYNSGGSWDSSICSCNYY